MTIAWKDNPVHERDPPINIAYDVAMLVWYKWVFGRPDGGYRRVLRQSSVQSGLVVLVKEANISMNLPVKEWSGASVVTRRFLE